MVSVAETQKYAEQYLTADMYRNKLIFWFCSIHFQSGYSITEFYYNFLCCFLFFFPLFSVLDYLTLIFYN